MKFKKISVLASIILSTAMFNKSYAEDVYIVTDDTPLESAKAADGSCSGIGCDTIIKAFQKAGLSFTINWVSWGKAQQNAIESKSNVFIIPLTRNAKREPDYIWISKIYNNDTAFIRKKGAGKISSFKDANGVKIGVLFKSSYEESLNDTSNGIDISEVEAVPSEKTNAKKLNVGKIGAWYTGLLGAFDTFKDPEVNANPSDFEAGPAIISEENYIATGKNTPPEIITKVRNAMEAFKATPEYNAIINKYTKGN